MALGFDNIKRKHTVKIHCEKKAKTLPHTYVIKFKRSCSFFLLFVLIIAPLSLHNHYAFNIPSFCFFPTLSWRAEAHNGWIAYHPSCCAPSCSPALLCFYSLLLFCVVFGGLVVGLLNANVFKFYFWWFLAFFLMAYKTTFHCLLFGVSSGLSLFLISFALFCLKFIRFSWSLLIFMFICTFSLKVFE